MEISKQKNIASTVVFGILQLVLLFLNFSPAACVSTGVIIVYWLVRNVIINYDGKNSIHPSLGNYIGLTIVNIMIIAFINMVKVITFDKFLSYRSAVIKAAVVLAVAIAVIKVLSSFTKNKGSVLNVIIKYTALVFIAYTVLMGLTSDKKFQYQIVVTLLFVLPFYMFDLYEALTYERKEHSLFLCSIISLIIFFLIYGINSDYAFAMFNYFLKLNAVPVIKWYVAVIVVLLFVVLSIVHYVLSSVDGKEDYARFYESTCCLLLAYDFACYAIGVKFYTKYLPAFAVAVILVNLITLFSKGIKINSDSDEETNKFITSLLLQISLIFVYFGFLKGIADIFVILIIGVLCTVLFREKRWAPNLFVVLCAVFCCDIAYHYDNNKNIFIFIISLALLISVVLFTLNFKSKGLENENVNILKIIICAVMFFAMVSPFFHNGVKITTDVNNKLANVDKTVSAVAGENNNITVKLKPHGKNNSVAQCVYYWSSESDKAAQAKLDENLSFVVEPKQDKLVVVCTDEKGVVSKYEHTFSLR